jgi:hypothetical protein
MADLFQEVYLPRAQPSDDATCLVLHPDGTISMVTKAEHNKEHKRILARYDPASGVVHEGSSIGTTMMYGYNTTMICTYHARDLPENKFARSFLRACKTNGNFVSDQYNTMMRGPAYLLDDHRSLSLQDWQIFKHCWRSQTAENKAVWKEQEQTEDTVYHLLFESPNERGPKEVVVHYAKNPYTLVYAASTSNMLFEIQLAKKELMLLARPLGNSIIQFSKKELMLLARHLGNSMEWTVELHDSYEYCEENPTLCATKYAEELSACEKLRSFQEQHNLGSHAFRPDTSIPVITDDMHTFVWVQTGGGTTGKSRNKTASKLLQMEVFGDAIIGQLNGGYSLKNTAQADVRAMMKVVSEKQYVCDNCRKRFDTKLLICSKCEFACYCSTACQRQAWSSHKLTCVLVEMADQQ